MRLFWKVAIVAAVAIVGIVWAGTNQDPTYAYAMAAVLLVAFFVVYVPWRIRRGLRLIRRLEGPAIPVTGAWNAPEVASAVGAPPADGDPAASSTSNDAPEGGTDRSR